MVLLFWSFLQLTTIRRHSRISDGDLRVWQEPQNQDTLNISVIRFSCYRIGFKFDGRMKLAIFCPILGCFQDVNISYLFDTKKDIC